MTTRVGIVGGGIVGVALAHRIAGMGRDVAVTVLEKEPDLARHQTGRNSGVVHAGLYYSRARSRRGCAAGASSCWASSAPATAWPTTSAARSWSPSTRASWAAWRRSTSGPWPTASPGCGWSAARSWPSWSRTSPGSPPCTRPTPRWSTSPRSPGGWPPTRPPAGPRSAPASRSGAHARTPAGRRRGRRRAAGLHELVDLRRAPHRPPGPPGRPRRRPAGGAVPGRVLRARPGRRDLVNGLVYPVPDPRYPFLGVHLTKRVDGGVLVGPNAVLALAREGYRWHDLRLGDLAETLAWPGFRRMAARHWRTGVREVVGSLSRRRSATPPAATSPSCGPPTCCGPAAASGPRPSPATAPWSTTSASAARAGSSPSATPPPRRPPPPWPSPSTSPAGCSRAHP